MGVSERFLVDLTNLEGVQSLGGNFENYLLNIEIKEVLRKLKEAVDCGLKFSLERKDKGGNYYIANNIFIDGKRGSGKTTVLLTIKELLENSKLLEKTDLQEIEFLVVESLIDSSVNTQSITFYLLSWLKRKIESEHKSNTKLLELLYETINTFPSYLRTCEKICKELDNDYSLDELLDKSDLTFRRNLFKLIDEFLKVSSCSERKVIVLFIDDIDISFPLQRIEKILTEIFMFLSHPRLIVITAGNYRNLLQILECYINKASEKCFESNKALTIAKSILEKNFSSYKVELPYLRYNRLNDIVVRYFKSSEDGVKEENIRTFLERIRIVELIGWDSLIFQILFDEISVRELVLLLKEALHRLDRSENPSTPLDYCFSDIYLKVKNVSNTLSLENLKARGMISLSSVEKPSEFLTVKKFIFEFLSKILEEDNEGKLNPLINEYFKQSVLAYSYLLDTREFALFWLWFIEHLLFMDGFKNSALKILFLELIRAFTSPKDVDIRLKDFKERFPLLFMRNTLDFWERLNFDFKELKEFLTQYSADIGVSLKDIINGNYKFRLDLISKTPKLESILRIPISSRSTNIPDDGVENLREIWKDVSRSDIVFLEDLFAKIEKAPGRILKLKVSEIFKLEGLLSNFIDKLFYPYYDSVLKSLREEEGGREFIRYAYNLIIYINAFLFIVKVLYLEEREISERTKDIFMSKELEQRVGFFSSKRRIAVQSVMNLKNLNSAFRKLEEIIDILEQNRKRDIPNDVRNLLEDIENELETLRRKGENTITLDVKRKFIELIRLIEDNNIQGSNTYNSLFSYTRFVFGKLRNSPLLREFANFILREKEENSELFSKLIKWISLLPIIRAAVYFNIRESINENDFLNCIPEEVFNQIQRELIILDEN